jgi:GAF domain-containing protein
MQELPEESVERFARVQKLLRTQRTLPARLESVVAIARRTVPNCNAAAISLIVEGEPTTSAVTDRLAVEIDLVQYQTGQGPCLEAMAGGKVIRVEILERDQRFSRFAPGALDKDINSVLSMPLSAGDQVVGALNLYSRLPNAFNANAEQAAQPLADYAGDIIATSALYAYALDMVDGLVESLENQAIIAQAIGILTTIEQQTSEEALERLRTLALASGHSMRTVAAWVIEERPRGTSMASRDQLPGDDMPE